MKKLLFALAALLFWGLNLNAQSGWIKGAVTDKETGEALIAAKVVLDSSSGALTDENGSFLIKTTPGWHSLVFTYGDEYEPIKRSVVIPENDTAVVDVEFSFGTSDMDIVVISGSQYEKPISEEIVTIDVIKPYLMENTTSPDLSDAVKKVPGVNITDGQASIRGGSGYSYGAGSRVQVLVDGLPLISADLGDVWWSFVPMENAAQIEVIKGAASVLYGSGAMNGVIHVRTGYAQEKPETKVQLYQGVYVNPKRDVLRWWEINEQPTVSGGFFSHRRRIGQLDLVVGGNFMSEKSYIQTGDRLQGRLNWNTRYRSKKDAGLSFGLNGNFMYNHFGRFFLWTNKDDGAYKPFNGSESREKYSLVTLDPHFTKVTENGITHNFWGRYYMIRKNLESIDPVYSHLWYGKYQIQKRFESGTNLTGGIVGQHTNVRSNLFNNVTIPTYFGALYAQADHKFGKRLTVLGGVRYEINQVADSTESSNPVFRTGANYKAAKATFLRASVGQGYRFPALSERFTDADLAGLYIFPNPSLQPERGWSAEIGVKQGVKVGNWMGYIDAALFWMEYYEMASFEFVIKNGNFGFQTANVGRARIAGFELSTMGRGNIGTVPVRVFGGYTFNFPGDLESDTTQRAVGKYLGNLFRSFGGVEDLRQSILRYRYRHNFTMDVEADIWRFMIGTNVWYNTRMDNIDGVLELIVPGVVEWREQHRGGALILNVRAGYRMNENATVTMNIKNLLNTEYTERAGYMGPPMQGVLQFMYKF